MNNVDPLGLKVNKVKLVGTASEINLFNLLVARFGLSTLYAGMKGPQGTAITINLKGDARILVGRGWGLANDGIGDFNHHYIDIKDIEALANAGNKFCPGLGDKVAGSALAHELVEAAKEGQVISKNPLFYYITEEESKKFLGSGSAIPRADALWKKVNKLATAFSSLRLGKTNVSALK